MRQTYLKLWLAIGSIFTIQACDKNPHKVDVSDIDEEVKFFRYEEPFFNLTQEKASSQIAELYKEHPEMSEFVVERMFRAKRGEQIKYERILQDVQDSFVRSVYKDVSAEFSDIKTIEDQATQGFKYVKYHFPNDTIPKFYTFLSLSDLNVFTYPGILVFCPDRYMGPDYNYAGGNTPQYIRQRMSREYAPAHIMKTYFSNKFPEESQVDGSLLSYMAYYGKQLYYLDATLPETPDHLKIEYDQDKIEWAKNNEHQLYTHLVDENLFYETDRNKIKGYIDEAPFTNAAGVPRESPPRLGHYLGWQIVRHYMKNNSVSLADLMNDKDYKTIFRKARYKP